jgi:hypothetical protein
MSIVQTVLVFVAIPLGVVLIFAAMIFGRSSLRQSNRYRPGRPWKFEPVWYLPHPTVIRASAAERRALDARSRPAIESHEAPTPSAVGGASGEW